MALKYKYVTKQEIPTEQQSLYVERDGAWLLDADGVVEKSKLDEFRTTNVALMKERDDLAKKFEGIDPEAFRPAPPLPANDSISIPIWIAIWISVWI